MTEQPITQVGCTVVITGAGLPLMYRAVLALIARRSRDGLSASPLLNLARTTFYRACMSAQRRKGGLSPRRVTLQRPGPSCEPENAKTPVSSAAFTLVRPV